MEVCSYELKTGEQASGIGKRRWGRGAELGFLNSEGDVHTGRIAPQRTAMVRARLAGLGPGRRGLELCWAKKGEVEDGRHSPRSREDHPVVGAALPTASSQADYYGREASGAIPWGPAVAKLCSACAPHLRHLTQDTMS